ncbi:hypothetical protein FRC02_003780 [Tulasnella sp. 418]|nr:hypothetical protein FRC02_003780 [Tulasnella sp. 418]
MPSKRKSSDSASKKALTETNAQLSAEIAQYKRRVEQAEAAHRKMKKQRKRDKAKIAKAEAAAAAATSSNESSIIERPPGQNRKQGWKLIDCMQLGEESVATPDEVEENKRLYNAMMHAVRTAMAGAQWDYSKGIKQPPEVLYQVYAEARQRQPRLARYQNDWATHEMALQYCTNRRAHIRKVGGDLSASSNKENHNINVNSIENHCSKQRKKQNAILKPNNTIPNRKDGDEEGRSDEESDTDNSEEDQDTHGEELGPPSSGSESE